MQHTATHSTGWRRLIEHLKLQVIFRKRATNYRALLQKMTYEDTAPYDTTPPCTPHSTLHIANTLHHIVHHILQHTALCAQSKRARANQDAAHCGAIIVARRSICSATSMRLLHVCVCVCVCVCERERERERERECVCVCVRERESACACSRE